MCGSDAFPQWYYCTVLRCAAAQVSVGMVLNLDGLYIGDRYKKGPVWYPKQVRQLYRT